MSKAKLELTWYDRWVLSFLTAALSIIAVNAQNEEFLSRYKTVLKRFIQTAEVIKPYVGE